MLQVGFVDALMRHSIAGDFNADRPGRRKALALDRALRQSADDLVFQGQIDAESAYIILSLVRLLRRDNAQIFPGVDAGAVPVIPSWLHGVIADRDQRCNRIRASRRQLEDIVRRVFHTHFCVPAAAFNAGASLAQLAQGVFAHQAVRPLNYEFFA